MTLVRDLPLYSAAQTRELDHRAIQGLPIAGYALMCRAAVAAWDELRWRRPNPRRIDVVCGPGNNGGDGYVLARLAQADGVEVRVWSLGQPQAGTEAAQALGDWSAVGTTQVYERGCLREATIVVDAIYGTGLSRAPSGLAAEAIEEIRALSGQAFVLAIDLPSGLSADTGQPLGTAVKADLSVSFIGRKLGLYTGAGPELCGEKVFCDLGVPQDEGVEPAATLLDESSLAIRLPKRARTAHKGSSGFVTLAGGDEGYIGAILMATRSALRAGAGMVTVATRGAHAAVLAAAQPEAMFRPTESADDFVARIDKTKVVAIGPGLGQGDWGRALWRAALRSDKPLVVDADALNLLAADPQSCDRRAAPWILTPHPGEAARLLGCTVAEIEADRVAAVREVAHRYGGTVVLKGAGTLVCGQQLAVCPYGNPGMAVGGMGDALTGIIAAFVAQGLAPEPAAQTGVMVHALAGDVAAKAGERGLLPSDLIECLRQIVNPKPEAN